MRVCMNQITKKKTKKKTFERCKKILKDSGP